MFELIHDHVSIFCVSGTGDAATEKQYFILFVVHHGTLYSKQNSEGMVWGRADCTELQRWKTKQSKHTCQIKDYIVHEFYLLCLFSGWCYFVAATEAGPESEVKRARQETSKTAGGSSRHAGLHLR